MLTARPGRLDMVARPKELAGEPLPLLGRSAEVACNMLTRFCQVWRPATAFLFGGISFTTILFASRSEESLHFLDRRRIPFPLRCVSHLSQLVCPRTRHLVRPDISYDAPCKAVFCAPLCSATGAADTDTSLNNTADYAWTHLMMGAFILVRPS